MFKRHNGETILATAAIVVVLAVALSIVVHAMTDSVVFSTLSGIGLALYLSCETIIRTRGRGN